MQWFSIIVVAIMVCFALVGIVDLAFLKNKLGLGEEFKKGIEMIGPLVLSIAGIISFAPLIAWAVENSLGILYKNMGLDPAMAVSMILAMDMGGYQVSMSVATSPVMGTWASLVYGSMMGATVIFTIPVGIGIIQKKDVGAFAKGILYGVAAIPVGTFVGGLVLGIDVVTVLLNLIIPVIFSAIIILCLSLWPNGTIKVFKGFSVFINVFGLLALGVALVNDLVLTPIANTGAFNIADVPFFNMLAPLSDGIAVSGSIGLVLCGALPFVYCLNKLLKRHLSGISAKTGFSENGILGFLLTAANNLATFAILGKMKEREKIINIAWAVSGAFIIGDHLAFVASVDSSAIGVMMLSKFISGAVAIIIAVICTRKMKNDDPVLEAIGEQEAEQTMAATEKSEEVPAE